MLAHPAGGPPYWPHGVQDRLDVAILAMSVVSVAELRAGHIRAGWGETTRAKAEAAMAAYLWVPIDMVIVDRSAELRALTKSNGWSLGDNDIWIAATAMCRGWPLATTDLDFCPLPDVELIYVPAKADSPPVCP